MESPLEINPFAARYHAPGAVPWFLPRGAPCLADMARRLAGTEQPWAIVGPHGSGKSAWAEAIADYLSVRHGWFIERQIVPPRPAPGGAFPRPAAHAEPAEPPTLLILDGLERAGRRHRRMVLRQARNGTRHILVTLHRAARFPVLARTRPTPQLAWRIVAWLVRHVPADQRPSPRLVKHLFDCRGGNLRDLLFDLYDWWEARRGRYVDPRLIPHILRHSPPR